MPAVGKAKAGATAVKPARAGTYEQALEILTSVGGDEGRQAHMQALIDKAKTADEARHAAEQAAAASRKRAEEAHAAEAAAVTQRQELADETTQASAKLTGREQAVLREERRLRDWLDDVARRESAVKSSEAALRIAAKAIAGFAE